MDFFVNLENRRLNMQSSKDMQRDLILPPNRREREVNTPKKRKFPEDSKETLYFSKPCSSRDNNGQRTHSGVQPSGSGETSRQKDTGSQKKKRKQKELPEELGIQFKKELAITSSFATRPGEGDLGKRIKLLSNCFPIKVPSGNVYHYDVSIARKGKNAKAEDNADILPAGVLKDDVKYRCLSTKKNREIIKLMLNTNPIFHGLYCAYDGQKNMYTRFSLRTDFPIECEVILPDENDPNPENPPAERRQDEFQVQIKPVNKMDSESCAVSLDSLHAFYNKQTNSVPQESIMALETILRHGPCLKFTPIGRSFFYPPHAGNLHPLGGGLEIWFGYHQSLRLGQWKPMVNLDVTATTFHERGPVLQFIADCMNTNVGDLRRIPILPPLQIKRISNKLKNLRVEVNHMRNYRRKYRIFKITKESANNLEFELTENGRAVKKTVAAYFRERYNRNLDFPNLPCLQVYPEIKKCYLPIEVCDIVVGQHSKRNLDAKQKAKMIKFTAKSPYDRFSDIRDIANMANFNSDTLVREFGIEVSHTPLDLEGRVLDAPSLRYSNQEVKPKDGSWNMRNTKLLRGAVINSWVLLSFAGTSFQDLRTFSDVLLRISRDMGISIKSPEFVEIIDPFRCEVGQVFTNMKTKHKATLAVIVVPENNKLLYGKIKQVAETSVGLRTQCIKESNVTNPRKCNPQLVSNLCLKINTKMGGENNSLVHAEIPPVLWEPVIIIGADVNHPGLSRDMKPSLAACVCSLDNRLSRFAVCIRVQPNLDENKKSVEIIVDLKGMVRELLIAFFNHTRGKKPGKVIFYRDGVSEGQFSQVQDKELRSIRDACQSLSADYQPGITFIVVQKRHHVRFMPSDLRDGVGAMKNIPPGTMVDNVVTHPVNFDYYLCSHFGLKGTSRPSHYTVLEDDNDFSANDIQKLTYQLCYTYARCTRSISIPVPVAYADLAAYRARLHIESAMDEQSTSGSDSSDEDNFQRFRNMADAIKVIPEFSAAMYFV